MKINLEIKITQTETKMLLKLFKKLDFENEKLTETINLLKEMINSKEKEIILTPEQIYDFNYFLEVCDRRNTFEYNDYNNKLKTDIKLANQMIKEYALI